MKRQKLILCSLFLFFLLPLFPLTASANSSWYWISETRPYDILPWVAIATLLIETAGLLLFAKTQSILRTFSLVAVANALSFAAPYLINLQIYSEEMFPYRNYLEKSPSYTVGFLFCMATVFIELPIVYYSLRKHTASKTAFIFTIVGSNIVTTILVAIVERLFCVGQW